MFIVDVVNKLKEIFHDVKEHIHEAREDKLEAKLDELVAKSDEHLDWRTSMTDFAKLIGVDGSLASRVELAKELGFEGHFTGTAEQNNWLHRETFKSLMSHDIKLPS